MKFNLSGEEARRRAFSEDTPLAFYGAPSCNVLVSTSFRVGLGGVFCNAPAR